MVLRCSRRDRSFRIADGRAISSGRAVARLGSRAAKRRPFPGRNTAGVAMRHRARLRHDRHPTMRCCMLRTLLMFLSVFVLSAPALAGKAPSYTYTRVGNAGDVAPATTSGTVLMGG